MPEKTNQKRLEEYLVGENGYLTNNISNGKVIMISGKWGSGKTHFWQNIIATGDLQKELNNKREVYTYVSLYGKSSIEEIENDIFSQAYFSAIGGENFITKGFATFTKRMKRYGSSKIAKVANGLREEQKDNIERTALSRLNNGGIICFDDFERKSKDIDLNDLFGFITQLTLNFDCKVVIILNDDVFEGKEKDIFSRVKEKTVSKFLMYNPSIKNLFDSIFDNEPRYKILDEYRDVILKTIEETEELNARIYIQVLDNLIEWINITKITSLNYLKYLIYVNINFILNHIILCSYIKVKDRKGITIIRENLVNDENKIKLCINTDLILPTKLDNYLKEERKIENLKDKIKLGENRNQKMNTQAVSDSTTLIYFIDKNVNLIKSFLFLKIFNLENLIASDNLSENDNFNKINNFIETGILIDE